MKIKSCPKCSSNNIKVSTLGTEEGYIGYCTCYDCYFQIKSNSDRDRVPEMWSSRYEASKVAKLLWNDIATHWPFLSMEQTGYICNRGIK